MADSKITALTAITGANVATGDEFVMVDVSDTTMAASGTDKNITATELANAMSLLGPVKSFGVPYDGTETKYSLPNVHFTGNTGNEALTAGRIYYHPLRIVSQVTITELATQVTTAAAAGTHLRYGIYQSGANWQPGSLVIDAGAVLADSTGIKSITGLAATLTAGLYMIAVATEGAPTVKALYGAGANGPSSASAWGVTLAQLYATATYGALASTGVAWTAHNDANTGFAHHVLARW